MWQFEGIDCNAAVGRPELGVQLRYGLILENRRKFDDGELALGKAMVEVVQTAGYKMVELDLSVRREKAKVRLIEFQPC